jgi:hypothetical protein
MKSWLATGVIGLMAALVGGRAEEAFSKAIRPEDFAAAELAKLSPEALARLDALVQAYKSGAVTAARVEAEAQAARVAAETAAREQVREKEKEKAAAPGFFAKAKVLLAPGTQVEYGEIESRIAGEFTGWSGRTVFTLENGQRWQVANGGSYYSPAVANPKVKVFPAALGGFWMKIEGVNPRVKVLPLDK